MMYLPYKCDVPMCVMYPKWDVAVTRIISIQIMITNQNEPPFIEGLKNAKKILLQLRARKVRQQESHKAEETPVKDQPEDDRPDRSKSANTHKVEEVPEPASFKDRTFELHEKINEIGRELFECHNECESFESIFTNLAKFYADNLPTIELNEKLKKKSFQLKEAVDEYSNKIEKNHKEINDCKRLQQQAKKIAKEHLWNYLVAEADRAQDEPHPRVRFSHDLKEVYGAEREEEAGKGSLQLRYNVLRKQVVRKPVVRKATAEEEELRRPFYSSQLYSL